MDSQEAKRKLIGGWIGMSIYRLDPWGRSRRPNSLVVDELLQYLQNEVPAYERQRLLKLPREKMLDELRGMYFDRARRQGAGNPGGPRRGGRPDHGLFPTGDQPDAHSTPPTAGPGADEVQPQPAQVRPSDDPPGPGGTESAETPPADKPSGETSPE